MRLLPRLKSWVSDAIFYEKERIVEYSSVKDAEGLDDGGEFIKDYNPNSHRDI